LFKKIGREKLASIQKISHIGYHIHWGLTFPKVGTRWYVSEDNLREFFNTLEKEVGKT